MAETVVDALEAQHRVLEKLVLELNTAIASRDPVVTGERLASVRKLLDAHLGLEHMQFYPQFIELASADADVMKLIQLFRTNMKTIAEGVGTFFDRYDGKPIDLSVFVPEWKTTMKTLALRMKQEEETLHPMFRRLQKKVAPKT